MRTIGLDPAGLRRTRVRAQLLSGRRHGDVGAVVRAVVGVQAQDRTAAALALRVRGQGPAWILRSASRALSAAARRPSPVRLLPAFDTLLLGHADRGWLVPPAFARRVNAGGGMIRPTILTDDGVVATWSLRRREGVVEVDVEPFRRPEPGGTAPEVAAVRRFLTDR